MRALTLVLGTRLLASALLAVSLSARSGVPVEPLAEVAPPPHPQRIVSLNLCTDQILLQLVERERIAALSPRSDDPAGSAMYQEARGLPTVRGNAEEVLALQPDLVLVGTYTTRHTNALLRRFGIPVLAVPGANSFDEVVGEIRTVAKAVGEVERGEALAASFQARLAAMAARHPAVRPVAVQYRFGGYSAGSHTLYHDIFVAAGYDNGAARSGLRGYGVLPLEQLVVEHPDVVIGSDYRRNAPTQGNRLLSHPAIAAMGAQQAILPARETICGGPWNLDAAERIVAEGAK